MNMNRIIKTRTREEVERNQWKVIKGLRELDATGSIRGVLEQCHARGYCGGDEKRFLDMIDNVKKGWAQRYKQVGRIHLAWITEWMKTNGYPCKLRRKAKWVLALIWLKVDNIDREDEVERLKKIRDRVQDKITRVRQGELWNEIVKQEERKMEERRSRRKGTTEEDQTKEPEGPEKATEQGDEENSSDEGSFCLDESTFWTSSEDEADHPLQRIGRTEREEPRGRSRSTSSDMRKLRYPEDGKFKDEEDEELDEYSGDEGIARPLWREVPIEEVTVRSSREETWDQLAWDEMD